MKKNRRRGHDEEPAVPSPSPEQPAPARLSGQLPPGAVRGSRKIRTEAGHYLRATAHDDTPARFGTPVGQVDDAARRVWENAFGLVVRRRFEPDAPLAEISRTVATAVHEHATAALPLLDAEMLVRSALGEQVPTNEVDEGVLTAVHLLLFASLTDELALADLELDSLIAQAEKSACA